MEAHVKRQLIEITLTEADLSLLQAGGGLNCLPDHGDTEFIIRKVAGTMARAPETPTAAGGP